MRAEAVAFELAQCRRAGRDAEPSPLGSDLGDLRFRALLRERDWASLPPRSAAASASGCRRGSTVYAGEVLETWMSLGGWWLAQALRLIGGAAAADA